MTQVIKEKPAPKRGGFLYWLILVLFKFVFPSIFFVIFPTACIMGNFPAYTLLIPLVGFMFSIYIFIKNHKKLMDMSDDQYQKAFKIKITTGGGNNNPTTNINDAISSGQYFVKGSVFNPTINKH